MTATITTTASQPASPVFPDALPPVVLPNPFVARGLAQRHPGRLLLVGEGQQRNAIWAAWRGWDVVLVESCAAGCARIQAEADMAGVALTCVASRPELLATEVTGTFDAVVETFLHLPAAARQRVHRDLASLLAPGGVLLLELFAPDQLRRGRLCPRTLARMCGSDDLCGDLQGVVADLAVRSVEERDVELDEGPWMTGEARVIELVAERRCAA